MTPAIEVSTGSRLHFGLLRFAEAEGRSYGGVGMMISAPRSELRVESAEQWEAAGPSADRAIEFARRALEVFAPTAGPAPQALRLTIRSAIPPHRGLGHGTQLALATAAAVRRLCDLPPGSAAELAAAVGRGHRSAVGAHGFIHGGLLYDAGRPASGDRPTLGGLAQRLPIPETWRILLATPKHGQGLSGGDEQAAFAALPPVAENVAERLTAIIKTEMFPAARTADCDAFGEAVYEYGRTAGECFAPIQGGAYASKEIAELVARLRQLGAHGVGQSSWGPTVFAIVDSEEAGARLLRDAKECSSDGAIDFTVTAPENRGAIIS